MLLTFLGEELDSSIEHELIYDESKHPHGWDVVLTYKPRHFHVERVHTHHNCTEVHNRYRSIDAQIALESNIHGTGVTRYLYRLESVDITVAKSIADHH